MAGACEWLCDNTLRVPRRIPSAPIVSAKGDDPFWSTVQIPARDHAKLEASMVAPKKSNGKCVLMVHGIGFNRDAMTGFVPLFTSHGYRVLVPDDRAHGVSGGDLVTYGALEKFDAVDWAHWLKSEGCSAVYGFGESMGASILIQAAAVDPIFKAVIAECPFSDLRVSGEDRVQQMAAGLPEWIARPLARVMVESSLIYARFRFGVNLSDVSPVHDIAAIQSAVLLIHGLADTRTPPWHSIVLQKADPKAVLWLVPGARHVAASSTQPEEFNRRVLEWFAGR
jgi:pimeloyl-ACP methyl ester carboxylesterase